MITEQERLFKQLNQRFVKAFVQYGLLADGDRVLVGLSGGKDSLLLTELLARRARISHPAFTVEAAHVCVDNIRYETDTSYLQQFCQELGVSLHVISAHFDSTPPASPSSSAIVKPKPPCFLCSWTRRKQLFNLAQQLGCNKLALGHHQDDLLHTALMNLLYQGRFDTMPPCLAMKKMPLQIIRPLCLIPESLISSYASLCRYEKQLKTCPYEHDTNRTMARQLFEQAESLNPEVRFSLWSALEREGKLNAAT